MNPILFYAYKIPGALIAITVHEFVRALVSTLLGDQLPKKDKRLTLNPFKHFEPVGFILLLSIGFGWGKPVNTSALHYKKRKKGILLTAILPSIANLLVVLICLYVITYMPEQYVPSMMNIGADAVNTNYIIFFLVRYTMLLNVSLAVYNLLPITPMDCLKVLSVALPPNTYMRYLNFEKSVQIIVLLLLFAGILGGFFNALMQMVVNFLCLFVF